MNTMEGFTEARAVRTGYTPILTVERANWNLLRDMREIAQKLGDNYLCEIVPVNPKQNLLSEGEYVVTFRKNNTQRVTYSGWRCIPSGYEYDYESMPITVMMDTYYVVYCTLGEGASCRFPPEK